MKGMIGICDQTAGVGNRGTGMHYCNSWELRMYLWQSIVFTHMMYLWGSIVFTHMMYLWGSIVFTHMMYLWGSIVFTHMMYLWGSIVFTHMMYLWGSLCTLCLLACQVNVIVGDFGLCCICVTSFEH